MGMGHSGKLRGAQIISRTEAVENLRKLLARNKVQVDNAALDRLFRDHWDKLSMLAHQIHEGV